MDRALIIKKEWLDKIFNEGKIWEMRTTRTKIRGKVGLIESGSGLIVGEANIIGCSLNPIKPDLSFFDFHKVKDIELSKKWKYAWVLDNPIKYNNPIPYKHPKGAVIWVKF